MTLQENFIVESPSLFMGYLLMPKWNGRMLRGIALVFGLGFVLAARGADFDADGLPDAWQAQYGFSTNGYAAAGMVGWWQMDQTSQTNVMDRSGNNLNGTLNNFSPFPFVTGLFSNALQFSTNSWVSFNTVLIPMGPQLMWI